MKKLNTLLALVLLSSSSLAFTSQAFAADDVKSAAAKPTEAPAFKAHVLNRAELDALLAKPEQLVLIDVRRPDEQTAKGSFAVYLSIQAKDLEKSLAYIPKDRTIVTVSNHAGRAGKSADFLADKGYKVAGAAGVENYEAEGGKLTKLAPPAPKTADASAAK